MIIKNKMERRERNRLKLQKIIKFMKEDYKNEEFNADTTNEGKEIKHFIKNSVAWKLDFYNERFL